MKTENWLDKLVESTGEKGKVIQIYETVSFFSGVYQVNPRDILSAFTMLIAIVHTDSTPTLHPFPAFDRH
jgi:hypothetical protein